jgi:hypothetical protein
MKGNVKKTENEQTNIGEFLQGCRCWLSRKKPSRRSESKSSGLGTGSTSSIDSKIPALEFVRLTKKYRRVKDVCSIDDINLKIYQGKITVILGIIKVTSTLIFLNKLHSEKINVVYCMLIRTQWIWKDNANSITQRYLNPHISDPNIACALGSKLNCYCVLLRNIYIYFRGILSDQGNGHCRRI